MPDIEVQIGRLDERLKALDQKVDLGFKDLRDNIINRLDRIDSSKLSASDFITNKAEQAELNQDIENRMRFVERYLWGALGILALIQFIGFAYIFTNK